MKEDLKKVIGRAKEVQAKLHALLQDKNWMDEARKYAEQQGKELKKLLAGDAVKIKKLLERERAELARFQKQIPGEVKKFKTFLQGQSKELEKLLAKVRKMNGKTGSKKGGARRSKKAPASA